MAGFTITTISPLGLTVSGTAPTTLSIAATGGVSSSSGPAILADAALWTLITQGQLSGATGADGISLSAGTARIANQGYIGGQNAIEGDILLQNTGTIAGRNGAGILGAGSIVNRGTILGGLTAPPGESGAIGVALSGGTLIDGLIGLVRGAYEAVNFSSTGTIVNLGTLQGLAGAGVVLQAGGSLVNGAGTDTAALIYGHAGGVSLGGTGTVVNYGHIATPAGSGPRNGNGNGIGLAAGLVLNHGRVDGFNGIYGGAATIENSGTIAGGAALSLAIPFTGYHYAAGGGVLLSGGTLENTGLVLGGGIPAFPAADSGTAGAGVTLGAGYVLNAGSIAGGMAAGVTLTGGSGILALGGTMVNSGRLSGGVAYNGGTGLAVLAGAVARNSGTIQGGAGTFGGAGVLLSGGTLQNTGRIAGGDGTSWRWAIGLAAGADIYNGLLINAGLITGGAQQHIGVDLGAGTLINTGTLSGATGLLMQSGLAENAGLIAGGNVGVELGAGTLINAGTISGHYAVYMAQSAQRLAVLPGAAFLGTVKAKTVNATLELAPGTAAPSLATLDMGSSFSGFATIAFDSNAQWRLGGGLAQLAAGQVITGFTLGDTLALEGFSATYAQFIPGTGLELSNGGTLVTIGLTGDFASSGISAVADAAGTRIAICYARGTRIATTQGERPIETLDIGETLPCRFAGTQKITWIGRQNFTLPELLADPARWPVRINAGALGPGLPRRALTVSPGHSLLLEECLVLARLLVNGVTITQPRPTAGIAYYLIEFATHDCLRAEGVWAESFADGPGLRENFHNAAEFQFLYPSYRTPQALTLCAARPESGPALEAALRPVAARAARVPPGPLRGHIERIAGRCVEGWVQDQSWPELPQLLEFSAGGRRLGQALACHHRADLEAAGIGRGRAHFRFTAPDDFAAAALRIRRAADHAPLSPGAPNG